MQHGVFRVDEGMMGDKGRRRMADGIGEEVRCGLVWAVSRGVMVL